MKNIEKSELRQDVYELSNDGYSKKEGIKILVGYGYVKSTASNYWNIFAGKYAKQKSRDVKK